MVVLGLVGVGGLNLLGFSSRGGLIWPCFWRFVSTPRWFVYQKRRRGLNERKRLGGSERGRGMGWQKKKKRD